MRKNRRNVCEQQSNKNKHISLLVFIFSILIILGIVRFAQTPIAHCLYNKRQKEKGKSRIARCSPGLRVPQRLPHTKYRLKARETFRRFPPTHVGRRARQNAPSPSVTAGTARHGTTVRARVQPGALRAERNGRRVK